MSLTFKITKGHKIPFQQKMGGQRIEDTEGVSFWEHHDTKAIAGSRGVYVFCIKTFNTILPYYVGQAKKSFKQECFTPDKLNKYNSALSEYKQKFTPLLYFLIPDKKAGPTNAKAIAELEKDLIRWGKARNPEIKNIQHTAEKNRYEIKGVTDTKMGAPPKEAKEFKLIFGL